MVLDEIIVAAVSAAVPVILTALLPSATKCCAWPESVETTPSAADRNLAAIKSTVVKKHFAKATEETEMQLDCSNLGWGDAEAAQLAEILASGAAPRLEMLMLSDNEISDEGCKALAAALGKKGAAPRLKWLWLDGNEIGDKGCKALAAEIKEWAAPRLESLTLYRNQIGDEGCKALAELEVVCEERGISLALRPPDWEKDIPDIIAAALGGEVVILE